MIPHPSSLAGPLLQHPADASASPTLDNSYTPSTIPRALGVSSWRARILPTPTADPVTQITGAADPNILSRPANQPPPHPPLNYADIPHIPQTADLGTLTTGADGPNIPSATHITGTGKYLSPTIPRPPPWPPSTQDTPPTTDPDGPFSLGRTFKEFAGCVTIDQAIEAANGLAKSSFEFDMPAAVRQVLLTPRTVVLRRIETDTATAKARGLTAILKEAADSMRAGSLTPHAFIAKHPDCTLNGHLAKMADNGVSTAGGPGFVPNDGIGAPTYPDSVADNRVVLYLLAKGHAVGRFLILPTELFAELAAAEGLHFHVSPAFVVKKRDSVTGRLVINYSHAGPNFDAKPIALTDELGPIKPPQYADICRLLLNAKKVFPGQEIYGLRRDIDAAYNRLLYDVRSALTCAFSVDIEGKPHIVTPIVCMMGDQQVNFDFDQVTKAIAEVLAVKAKELSFSDLPLTTVATDDIIAIGGQAFIAAISRFIAVTVGSSEAPGLLGTDAIAVGKDLFGSAIEILGWVFDCRDDTIAPNPLTMAKLLALFFTALGPNPVAGQRISLPLLQRIASHAIRTANVVTAMLPYSRSFSAATANCSQRGDAFLTHTCVHDIAHWRRLLTDAVSDMRILTCPVSTPPIRQKLSKGESVAEHQARAAAAASVFAYSDAATGTADNGVPMLGGYTPGDRWFHLTLPPSTRHVYDMRNGIVDADINIHEATALILTAIMGVAKMNRDFPADTAPPARRHLNIYCDNTCAVSLLRTNRAHLPILSFLLCILTYLQVHHRCLITVSHIAGLTNTIADATSRDFAVPNGAAIRLFLSRSARQWTPSRHLATLIEDGYRSCLRPDWNKIVGSAIEAELDSLSSSC